jgi:hypothetical protein
MRIHGPWRLRVFVLAAAPEHTCLRMKPSSMCVSFVFYLWYLIVFYLWYLTICGTISL